ncbi:MAG: Gfo/Idh/MocA family oxidoreductase [Cytophagaceae bacterium]|nr:Gfo/Idh/MocA family oxidoreductase [Cytophagaceae bacterium]MBL0325118.1 Gfo/Idh/MocA family oxidoreductase [Cytophagaceae bacterium]
MKNTNTQNRRTFLSQAALTLGSFMIVPRHVLGGKSAYGELYKAPSDLINLGFIGTGKQGRLLANFFLNTGEIRISAISEVYKAKANQMLEHISSIYKKNTSLGVYSDIAVYNDYRELLSNKDIDAVVIATPDHQHAVMAVNAARAGKDIYCEKPLALTVKEGRAMVNAARKYKRVFQTGSMQRSWPEFRQAPELVRNGYLGEIKHIKVNVGKPPVKYNLAEEPIPEGLDWNRWLGPNEYVHFNSELAPPISKDVYPNWRNYREFGGGMVTDWGAHMFDIVQWALEMDASGPVSVRPADGKEIKHLTLQYASGITMTHEPWAWNNAIHFIGSAGEMKLQRGKIETTPADLATRVIAETEKHVYKSENHYKDFLQAMRNRSKPVCDVEIGHRTSSVCNIANIAYQLNRPLAWNPEKETFKDDKEANALLGRKLIGEWAVKI